MSTKIYNAFRFLTTDLLEVHRSCMVFRQKFKPLAEEKAAKWLVKRAVEELDRRTVRQNDAEFKPAFCSPFCLAWDEMLEKMRRVERETAREPDVDFSVIVSILPHATGLYGIIYTEQQDFRDMWFAGAGVVDFHYQNSTDRPSNVSEEEWERRERTWDEILGHNVPAECGFSADIVLLSKPVRTECLTKVCEYLPSFESRVDRVAYDLLLEEKLKAVPEEELQRKFVSIIMGVNRAKEEDPRVKARYEELKAVVGSMLRRDVTKEVLLQEPQVEGNTANV